MAEQDQCTPEQDQATPEQVLFTAEQDQATPAQDEATPEQDPATPEQDQGKLEPQTAEQQFLGQLAVLLRQEHNRLEVSLTTRFEQHEKLLRKLSNRPADRPEVETSVTSRASCDSTVGCDGPDAGTTVTGRASCDITFNASGLSTRLERQEKLLQQLFECLANKPQDFLESEHTMPYKFSSESKPSADITDIKLSGNTARNSRQSDTSCLPSEPCYASTSPADKPLEVTWASGVSSVPGADLSLPCSPHQEFQTFQPATSNPRQELQALQATSNNASPTHRDSIGNSSVVNSYECGGQSPLSKGTSQAFSTSFSILSNKNFGRQLTWKSQTARARSRSFASQAYTPQKLPRISGDTRCSDASFRRASTVLMKEVKLGKSSAERVIKDLEDQFKRLARKDNHLHTKILQRIVTDYCDDVSFEDVVGAVKALVPASDLQLSRVTQGCTKSFSTTFKNLFHHDQEDVGYDLSLDAFLLVMLHDDVPEEILEDVNDIREAVNNERVARQGELNELAVSRARQKGGYGDSPVIVDILGASMILLNGLVIGLNSDIETDHVLWRVLEYAFLCYFVGEVVFHLCREGCRKYFCGRDWRWNIFDFTLVGVAVLDATISEIGASSVEGGPLPLMSRTLRLARLSRLVRLLRFKVFAELKQMIYGVVAGIRVLAWAILLLIVFIYMVSLVIRQTIGDDPEGRYASCFRNVPWTMFTVFRCFTDGCTAPDGTPLQVYLYDEHGEVFMLIYVIVFLFVSIGIFNLIMATFIDNVMAVSTVRKQIERASNDVKLKAKLVALIVRFWKSDQDTLKRMKTFGSLDHLEQRSEREESKTLQGMTVTRDMLQLWLCHPDMIDILDQLEISHSDHGRLFDTLDCDLSGELDGNSLVQGMMALRGPIDKMDVVSTMLAVKYMAAMMKNLEEALES